MKSNQETPMCRQPTDSLYACGQKRGRFRNR